MEPHWLAILLLTPLPILLAVALYAWPQRAQLGPRLLLALMLTGSVATIAYAGELFGQTLEIKLVWLSFWYVSMNLVPWLMLLLALWHTGREHWLAPRRIVLLLAPVVIILLLYFANPWHHQFYHRFGLDPAGLLPVRTSVRGPLYWVDMALVYAYLLATVVLLTGAWRTMPSPYNTQSAVLLLAALAPMIGAGLHLLGVNAFGYVNFAALSCLSPASPMRGGFHVTACLT
ncbi:MAG: hypothetical protein IPK16_19645 [Anaerolineales bacterium]|nr:hypothetical protein [Anaerolineales bacterium]